MAYLLLIRHGQNDWVKKNRLAGWTPGIHLNDAGRKQAEQLANRLSDLPLKAVYSSPLERCMETAAAITVTNHLEVQPLDAMGEVRYGKWEGKKIKKLSKKPAWHTIQHFPSRFRFPDGESLLEVQQRAVAAIEELAREHKDQMFAIVSHADVIKVALAHYLGMHIDLFQRLTVSTASVSLIAFPEGSVRVLRVNDHGPIEPPSSPKKDAKADRGHNEHKVAGESTMHDPAHSGSRAESDAAPSTAMTEAITE